jgi:hypothetical protein
MKNAILTLVAALLLGGNLSAQQQGNADCNKLGAWLWYIDITGFQTHAQIADTLAALGIKRIYIKVADGTPNTTIWPELVDATIPPAYLAKGIEPWAWSYNYPNNSVAQANALKTAAQTGYVGYVVDVEQEFDNASTTLTSLFSAFANKKQEAITAGHADSTFQLYCTTWGNPKDHNYRIDLIDPHVDGFMPQTYVEVWGQSYVNELAYWIGVGNQEYAELGATKPIHHIAALETGGMTAAQINTFIETSGPETSLWRIPGASVPQSLWNTWANVEWDMDFCAPSSTLEQPTTAPLAVAPNPMLDYCMVNAPDAGQLVLYDALGRAVLNRYIAQSGWNRVELPSLTGGIYFWGFRANDGQLLMAKVLVGGL